MRTQVDFTTPKGKRTAVYQDIPGFKKRSSEIPCLPPLFLSLSPKPFSLMSASFCTPAFFYLSHCFGFITILEFECSVPVAIGKLAPLNFNSKFLKERILTPFILVE